MDQCVKRQADIKRIIFKSGVLKGDEASQLIKWRRKEEVQKVQQMVHLKGKRGSNK